MEQHGIQINRKIMVTRAGGEEEWYVSSVQDIDDNTFCISIPIHGPVPLVLNMGDAVKISLVTDMSRVEFETVMVGWRHDKIQLYELALPKEYKRVQLREFARIPAVFEVSYAGVPDAGQRPVFSKCDSLDLSGGGMRLSLKENYAVDTRLMLRFKIPFKTGPEEIEVTGRVVRTWPAENAGLYRTALQFENISRRQQDLIVRYMFMKMSEQRRLR